MVEIIFLNNLTMAGWIYLPSHGVSNVSSPTMNSKGGTCFPRHHFLSAGVSLFSTIMIHFHILTSDYMDLNIITLAMLSNKKLHQKRRNIEPLHLVCACVKWIPPLEKRIIFFHAEVFFLLTRPLWATPFTEKFT